MLGQASGQRRTERSGRAVKQRARLGPAPALGTLLQFFRLWGWGPGGGRAWAPAGPPPAAPRGARPANLTLEQALGPGRRFGGGIGANLPPVPPPGRAVRAGAAALTRHAAPQTQAGGCEAGLGAALQFRPLNVPGATHDAITLTHTHTHTHAHIHTHWGVARLRTNTHHLKHP